jgi:hypothetical protein
MYKLTGAEPKEPSLKTQNTIMWILVMMQFGSKIILDGLAVIPNWLLI